MSAEVPAAPEVGGGETDAQLDVVLCWHMHQPQYFERERNVYALPWTYLHAIKDYSDMAAHLEAASDARVVVNFAPILLEQIDDYARRIRDHLDHGEPIPDPVLALLAADAVPDDAAARAEIIRVCLRAHAPRMIEPIPLYRALADIAQRALEDPVLLRHLDAGFFLDLATCYHLAWLGATVRRERPQVQHWLEREQGFDPGIRRELLQLIGEVIAGIIPRYRRLAEQGQVELSFTPYAHPIMPLLLDIESAREAMPDIWLPQYLEYPGGEERLRWHIERGIDVFRKHFGLAPAGCWPSEGSVSTAALRLLDEYGLTWTASGQTVLANSLAALPGADKGPRDGWLHRPYRLEGTEMLVFFRDDGLSDAIGFRYADWHADDAVEDFVHHLENIVDAPPVGGVVTVILDGENAWEYYPDNGFHFLDGLYARLSKHPRIRLRTFSDVYASGAEQAAELPSVVAGSWVYGTFSTWIGDPDKNAGWDRLIEAKQAVDTALCQHPELNSDALAEQLAVCEGSDWCWWFGAYNPAGSVSDFELLYRQHLAALYRRAGLAVPPALSLVLSTGGGEPDAGGTMRRGQAHS
ncbi:glycoside hydrolase family 57 protein [Thioalkalivibrio paradoxus]|uniref:Glycoside hydrolase n=1 Tax=Thioalkalivibrio paradoxus ARh 1 TaxID=713585 RepID=W0DIV0_9GAMM|nr:glycoside hydrolase family 57 protein [Thioalkalivibrio paradoxus]AHE98539.1 glycoside hydrolase [Thioalkalivibrio paradoxus ARh 1]